MSVAKINTPREIIDSVSTISSFLEKLREASNILVVVGAGISVSSGIPDFRSKDGIYDLVRSLKLNLSQPEDLFDLESFIHDPKPFYSFAKEKMFSNKNHRPTATHWFLKNLEEKGKILRIYTQNIDGLERKVGLKRVVPCHGSLLGAICLDCKQKYNEDIKFKVLNNEIPSCDTCGGLLKPNITFFGEPLSRNIGRFLAEDKKKADLVLVMGTSLKVAPVSKIIQMIPHDVPQILINREILFPTKKIMMVFDLNLLGDCDLIVEHLNSLLKWKPLSGTEKGKSSSVPLVRVLPNCYLFGGIRMSACIGVGKDEESEEIVSCDNCDMSLEKNAIVYTCTTCLDFDLCQKCYELELSNHMLDKTHKFKRL